MYCIYWCILFFSEPVSKTYEIVPKQEGLKEEDTDCIVNHDELTAAYEDTSSSSMPHFAEQGKEQPSPAENRDNVQDVDLGLGGFEFSQDRRSKQAQIDFPVGNIQL